MQAIWQETKQEETKRIKVSKKGEEKPNGQNNKQNKNRNQTQKKQKES